MFDFQEIPRERDLKNCLARVAGLIRKTFPNLNTQMSPEGMKFSGVSSKVLPGINEITGEIIDEKVKIKFTVLDGPLKVKAMLEPFLENFARIKCANCSFSIADEPDGKGHRKFFAEMGLSPDDVSSMIEQKKTFQKFKDIEALAVAIQSEVSSNSTDFGDLQKLYQPYAEILTPIVPVKIEEYDSSPHIENWANEILQLLRSGLSIAMESPHEACIELSLSILQNECMENGLHIGRFSAPAITAKGFNEICQHAPGIVAVQALQLSLNSSPYELANEAHDLLRTIKRKGKVVIYSGTLEELQLVFGGGQTGKGNDPLNPIVKHAPAFHLTSLINFSIAAHCRNQNFPISKPGLDSLSKIVTHAFDGFPSSIIMRSLQPVANTAVQSFLHGKTPTTDELKSFVKTVGEVKETLGGISATSKPTRSPHVTTTFRKLLSEIDLFSFFSKSLLGQEKALRKLVNRLKAEQLRPPHQPMCYLAVGTPGNGKSESASLIAQALGVPFGRIDAAALPDYYSAWTLINGAAIGIVGSYQASQLQLYAQSYNGIVLEISDLHGSPPAVRAFLANAFLNILQNGESQSGSGRKFSCSNMILAFTMNLPNRMDEKIRRGGIGYRNEGPSDEEIQSDFSNEIKTFLTTAFLSRTGEPIVFPPLNELDLSLIASRMLGESISYALECVDLKFSDIRIANRAGEKIIRMIGYETIISSGARTIEDKCREISALGILKCRDTLKNQNSDLPPKFDLEGEELKLVPTIIDGDIST